MGPPIKWSGSSTRGNPAGLSGWPGHGGWGKPRLPNNCMAWSILIVTVRRFGVMPRIRRRFLEMLWAQSGGLCQLTSFTAPCEASRQTLANYLDMLAMTGVVTVLRPYATNAQRELVAMPKVYGFDTGFVCHARGWRSLRREDCGNLWEHLVLDELKFGGVGVRLEWH